MKLSMLYSTELMPSILHQKKIKQQIIIFAVLQRLKRLQNRLVVNWTVILKTKMYMRQSVLRLKSDEMMKDLQ